MNFNQKDPQGNRATVAGASPYEAYREECAAMVSEVAVSRIRAAGEGLRSILTILQQREIDFDSDGQQGLKLSTLTTQGLLSAAACCVDFMELNATGDENVFSNRYDCEETDHWAVVRAANAAGEATKRPAKD